MYTVEGTRGYVRIGWQRDQSRTTDWFRWSQTVYTSLIGKSTSSSPRGITLIRFLPIAEV